MGLGAAVLRVEQYEVMTATTQSDARDRMRSTPADLVIFDLTLPDGDGLMAKERSSLDQGVYDRVWKRRPAGSAPRKAS